MTMISGWPVQVWTEGPPMVVSFADELEGNGWAPEYLLYPDGTLVPVVSLSDAEWRRLPFVEQKVWPGMAHPEFTRTAFFRTKGPASAPWLRGASCLVPSDDPRMVDGSFQRDAGERWDGPTRPRLDPLYTRHARARMPDASPEPEAKVTVTTGNQPPLRTDASGHVILSEADVQRIAEAVKSRFPY
jgi:hypothetical protein